MPLPVFKWSRSKPATVLSTLLLLLTLQFAPIEQAYAAPSALGDDMIVEVNQVRARAGLFPLAEIDALSTVAAERSLDMVSRNYFSHTTPDGRTVFNMLHERGIGYNIAGENLAWNTA